MLSTNLKRIIRGGFLNFWRNGTVSLASVLVMMVTLIVIGLISFSSAILDNALAQLRSQIDVNVTFIDSANEDDVLSVKHALESLPQVSLVTYSTAEEVLKAFKERHVNDQTIMASLDEIDHNPFGPMLTIQARDPSEYQAISQFLQGDNVLSSSGVTIVDRINYLENKTAIDRLTKFIGAADKIGFSLTILMAVIAMLIAFNTIRLTIYMSKDEISVMRLVGASNNYIRGPFIVVGIIYGLVAGILTLLIFWPLTYWLGTSTESFFGGFNLFTYYMRNIVQFVLIILAAGVLFGGVSSLLAIRKYLKI